MRGTALGFRRIAVGASVIAIVAASTAQAQGEVSSRASAPEASAPTDSADIVVTAQRRSESLQRVPIAITAISGVLQKELQIASVSSLVSVTPNLRVETPMGTNAFPRIFLRGLGTTEFAPNATSAVAIYRDEVIENNLYLQGLPAYDVERLEVLRGPQGTLFGKNTTGGLVHFISKAPTPEFGGYISGSFARFNEAHVEGAINGEVMPNLSARGSVYYQHNDGWQKNLIRGGRDGKLTAAAARVQLLYDAGGPFTAKVQFEHASSSGDALAASCRTIINTAGPLPAQRPSCAPRTDTTVNDNAGRLDSSQRAARLYLNYEGDNIGIHSVTSYDAGRYYQINDAEGRSTPANVATYDLPRLRQFYQELRFASSGRERLNWVVGGMFLKDSYVAHYGSYGAAGSEFGLRGTWTDYKGGSRSFALFGQADYKLLPRLTLAVGARYSWEHKDLSALSYNYVPNFNRNPALLSDAVSSTVDPAGRYNVEHSWGDPSWNIQLGYEASNYLNGYAKVSRGIRAGNYNGGTRVGVAPNRVDPERLTSYEIGIKGHTPDNVFAANVAFFYYDYRDLQLQQVRQTGTGGVGIVTLGNVKSADAKGIEVELTVKPVRGLTLQGSGAYLDSRYTDRSFFVNNPVTAISQSTYGNPLQRAPKWTLSGLAMYEFPIGDWTGRFTTDWNYRSRSAAYPLGFAAEMGLLAIEGGTIGNVQLSVSPSDKLTVGAFVNNVTNNNGMKGTVFYNLGFAGGQFANKPRIWGVRTNFTF
jgi:iron complex outermembrane receptor protein